MMNHAKAINAAMSSDQPNTYTDQQNEQYDAVLEECEQQAALNKVNIVWPVNHLQEHDRSKLAHRLEQNGFDVAKVETWNAFHTSTPKQSIDINWAGISVVNNNAFAVQMLTPSIVDDYVLGEATTEYNKAIKECVALAEQGNRLMQATVGMIGPLADRILSKVYELLEQHGFTVEISGPVNAVCTVNVSW